MKQDVDTSNDDSRHSYAQKRAFLEHFLNSKIVFFDYLFIGQEWNTEERKRHVRFTTSNK